MGRLALILTLALVASALALVSSRYDSRWAVIELDRARQEERELDIAWRRLQLELTHYAQHARIDQAAREALKMSPAPADRMIYVRVPAATLQEQGGRP